MNTETSTHSFPAVQAIRTGTKFISFYSSTEKPNEYLTVEHRSEAAAIKGSWQSKAMKAHWHYRGYVAV